MNNLRAHHDFETASAADLRVVGAHVYAMHPTTRVWVMCWRIGAGPIQAWRPGDPDPVELLNHVHEGRTTVAHNAMFERQIWNSLVRRVYAPHWPELRIAQQCCTLSRAAALSLPMSLDKVCAALQLPERKDDEGSRLMKQMAKPRKTEKDGSLIWWDDAARQQRLAEYCAQDVVAECAVDEALPFLSSRERAVWELDQTINDRGVCLDRRMISALSGVVEVAKIRLDDRMAAATGGAVRKCSQAAALVKWIQGQGVACTSVAAENHDDLVQEADALDPDEDDEGFDFPSVGPAIRHALDLRAEAAKASTAKLKRMAATMDSKGRSRGLLQYHATVQGRWAGRLWQPQNLKTREDDEATDGEVALRIAESMPHEAAAVADIFEIALRPPMEMVSLMLRSMLISVPNKKLIGGDLSNIEGRVNAWLSHEEWKLAAFQQYDTGVGPDLYRVAYSSSFGVPVEEVRGATRQVGKVQELSLGYQGSVAAYVKMARKKGIRLDRVRDTVRAAAPAEEWKMSCSGYDSARNKCGLDMETWAAINIIVKRYRKSNPCITQGWWDLQDAAVEAVADQSRVVPVFGGRVRYLCARGFLWTGLPSGRVLAYPKPAVVTVDTSYMLFEDGTRRDCEDFYEEEMDRLIADGVARKVQRTKHAVTIEAEEKGRRVRKMIYGGMQCAHVVSGIARDILVDAMFEAERRGYTLIMTVHDDLLCEVDDGFGTPAELQEIMTRKPAWIDGFLPLSAKCWEGKRNAK